MPSYKLMYFNGMGRAETTRMLFYMGGVDFQDVRLTREQWMELKPNTPFGQMPILEVDGCVTLCQAHAIEGYVAKQVGMVGKTDLDYARCHMLSDCIDDMVKPLLQLFSDIPGEKKVEIQKEYGATGIHVYLPKLEKLCNAKGYFVGDSITWPDLCLYGMMTSGLQKMGINAHLPGNKMNMDAYPNLQALLKNVSDNTKVKEWVSKRPDTEF